MYIISQLQKKWNRFESLGYSNQGGYEMKELLILNRIFV